MFGCFLTSYISLSLSLSLYKYFIRHRDDKSISTLDAKKIASIYIFAFDCLLFLSLSLSPCLNAGYFDE